MNKKGLDFKHKEVINITDGKRLGMVLDVTANLKTGTIESIIVPGTSKFTLFSSNDDIIIPWEKIEIYTGCVYREQGYCQIGALSESHCPILYYVHFAKLNKKNFIYALLNLLP